ncbi:hypothetical protein ACAX43_31790 [Paraburkholderia sp. IW21]|uniref:hypothetical protein n=1 Tax=Paraburkholderia sp. IW21 TaxID=3242488 RepID=UPI003520812E
MTGLLILALSFAFFSVYVACVYPLSVTKSSRLAMLPLRGGGVSLWMTFSKQIERASWSHDTAPFEDH